MRGSYLVFATQAYAHYSEALCADDCFEAGELDGEVFPDGERYQRIKSKVRGREVVLIGGTHNDSATLDLFDLACGLVQSGVNGLVMVVPYFGYATMERALHPGEIVTAKNRALLLSSVPRARVCNEVVLLDLHTAGITHYFEGHAQPYHLSGMDMMGDLVSAMDGETVLASTDAGRAKWVETLANRLQIPAAFVYKRRLSGHETRVRGVNADVVGKHVVIYDDMIRTGGSLIKAAQAYADSGAAKITALTSHGVLPGEALVRIEQSGLFQKVIATDSHPRALELAGQNHNGFFSVISMAPLIAQHLKWRL